MKIDRNKKGVNTYNPISKDNLTSVKRVNETTFNQELNRRQEQDSQQKMKDLLDDIDNLTKKLVKNLNINDLMLYKKMVKTFLQEATSLAYLLEQQRGRSRRGRTMLITVKTVDLEVENLIKGFLDNKDEPMEVLKRLDKIRGMLVDLMI